MQKAAAPLLAAVVTDVDGTLFPFGEAPQVSDGNIKALKHALDYNVHVCLATGRMPGPWSDRIRRQLPRLGASVFVNGSLVVDEDGTVLSEVKLPAAAVAAVEEYSRGGCAGAGGGRLCVLAATRWPDAGPQWGSLRYAELAPDGTESWVTRLIRSAGEPEAVLLPDLQPLLEAGAQPVLKFCLWTSPGEEGWCEMPTVVAALRKALDGTGATVLDCGPKQCEILPPECNKGSGVERLLRHLGVAAASTLACGDAENDVEMLKLVGVGAAMGNAKPAAKEVADAVVGTNDEDGVAQAVTQFVFGEKPP